ncbi:MAG: hypothetical protein OHK93_001646 [Ramalina farinacea]|uniref:Uncharacterized protein n=1 Tax=Ramalina farinacea TaxID=258253 RepID=A0AA43TWG6_9LECA|nr:hypothetical protein [Ramalina farinacea]
MATPRITPSASRYTNSSADACSLSCSSNIGQLTINYWTPLSIATTITAETVVTIINKKSNSTRVTTVTNQEVDFSKYPKPTNLNSDGIQTTLITDVDERGSGFTTITLTFPSVYVQYDSVYHLSGQIPTTVNGKSTCTSISKDDGAPISWPSHPPLPLTTGTVDSALMHQDPKGWTFFPMAGPDNNPDVGKVINDAADYPLIKSLFPDLPIWSCQGLASGVGNGPDGFSSTALFLTDTSTSIEDDEDADTATAHQPKTSVMVDPVSAQPTPSAKVEPSQTPQPPAPASIAQPPVPSQTPGKSTGSESSSSSSEGDTPSKPSISTENDGSAAQPGKTPPKVVPAPYSTPSGPDSLPAKSTTLGGQSPGTNEVHNGNSDTNLNPAAGGEVSAGGGEVSAAGGQVSAGGGEVSAAGGGASKSNAPLDTGNSHQGSVQHAQDATALTVPAEPVIFGGETLTPIAASQYVVAGHTIAPGPQPTTIENGNSAMPIVLQSSQGKLVFSVGSAGTVVPIQNGGGTATTQSFAPDGRPLVTSNAQGQYLVSGQTLSPGKINTVAGTLISLAPSGPSVAVLGSKTAGAAFAPDGLPLVTSNAQGQYLVSGQTLSPGKVNTVAGTLISLAPSGSSIANLGSETAEAAAGAAHGNGPSPVLTFGSQTITPDSQGHLVVAGQTLSPGGAPISVSGIPLSLNSAGDVAIIGGSKTQTLANYLGVTPAPSPALLTFGTKTVAPNSLCQYIVDGQTLSAGGAVTVSGTPFSLDSGGSIAVVGTKTESVGNGAIVSGLSGNGDNGSASRTGPTPFTGSASNAKMSSMAMAVSVIVWGLVGVIAFL